MTAITSWKSNKEKDQRTDTKNKAREITVKGAIEKSNIKKEV